MVLDAITERNHPEMQSMRDALVAVLDLHAAVDDGSGHRTVCGVCTDPAEGWDRIALPSPCPTVRVIAGKLGAEAHGA